MNSLQYGGHSADIGVDLRVGQEFGGEVRVQFRLDRCRCVYPECGIEEYVVQQLPRQEREAKQLNQDGLTCSGTYPTHLVDEL